MKEKGFWEIVQAAVQGSFEFMSASVLLAISSPYVTLVEMGLMSLFVYARAPGLP